MNQNQTHLAKGKVYLRWQEGGYPVKRVLRGFL